MLPFLSLFVFLLALLGILISFINAVRKAKNPSLKLKWVLIPLFLSFLTLIINRYVNTEISDLNERNINNLKKELGNTRSALDSAIKEQDSLKKENKIIRIDLDTTKGKLFAIEEKTADRIITKEQREKFIKFLKDKPKETVWVYFFMGDKESSGYAQQILKMLVSSGFKSDNVRPIMYSIPVTEIILRIKDLKFGAIANNIRDAFKLINIEIKGELNPKLETNFELFIGQKPN